MSNKILDSDFRTIQSLELFKNWLEKHPFLKYTGDDSIDDLLIFFLRIKKFSMQKVYECFEFNIQHIKSHPEWNLDLCPADYDFTNKPNSPFFLIKNLDAEGRRILIHKVKNYDDYDSLKSIRRFFMTPLFVAFDNYAQLNGIVLIVDFTDVNLGKLKKIPMSLINYTLKVSKNSLLVIKQIHIIGMPPFFKQIFDIAKSIISAKFLQRFNYINDVKELGQCMDVSLLPQEYGGSTNELMDLDTIKMNAEYINKIGKFEVNLSKIQDNENVGSFRKLEID